MAQIDIIASTSFTNNDVKTTQLGVQFHQHAATDAPNSNFCATADPQNDPASNPSLDAQATPNSAGVAKSLSITSFGANGTPIINPIKFSNPA